MDRRDDPIFDPWAIGGGEEAPAEAPGSESSARRWVVPLPSTAPPLASPAPLASPDPSTTRPRPVETRRERIGPRPSPHVRAMQSVALPRLEALRARLDLAGHDVVLDDRTGRERPSLRFRLNPRRAPFDEPVDSEGAVLEIVWDEDAAHVCARIWLDPIAEEWSEEVAAPTSQVDQSWIDHVILEFVARTLRT